MPNRAACAERERASLVAGVIQHHRHRAVARLLSQARQQQTDLNRRDIGGVGHGDDLLRHGIERAQDIEALASGGCMYKNTTK